MPSFSWKSSTPAEQDNRSLQEKYPEFFQNGDGGQTETGNASSSAPAAKPSAPEEPVDYSKMGAGEVATRAVQALPGSLGRMAGNIGYAATHLPEVGSAIWNLGEGAVSKAAGALGFEQNKDQKAKTERSLDAFLSDYAKRYGSLEGFKEAVSTDPASVLADLGTFIPGLGVGAKAAGLKSIAGVLDKAKYLDPLTAAAAGTDLALKPAMFTAKQILGVSTGTGKGVLDQIQDAARSTDRNRMAAVNAFAHGSGDPNEIVNDAVQAVSQAKQAATAEFKNRKGDLANTALPTTEITDALQKARDEIGATFDPNTGKWTTRYPGFQRELEALDSAEATIAAHQDFTPAGMHDLKVAINQDFKDRGIFTGRSKQGELNNVLTAIKKTIGNADQKYLDMMEFWTDHLDTLKSLSSGLSMNSRAGSNLQLSKLLKEMKKGKTPLIDILSKYPAGKYLKDKLAGASAHELFPNWFQQASPLISAIGAGGIGSGAAFSMLPHIAGAALASSPRAVGAGMALYGTGQRIGSQLAGKGLGIAGNELGEMAQGQPPENPTIKTTPTPVEGSYFKGGRVARRSGGRVGNPGAMAEKLIAAAEKAKNRHSDDTSPLLDMPDEAITKALAIANEKI